MRISTAGMHASALAGIVERNATLAKTQSQIASGKRIQTPADDPSGAVRALELDRALAESQQFARNIDVVTNRLSLEEQTLDNMTGLLQRVRDLTLQANNATVSQSDRQAIATEVKARLQDLIGLANRKDANGEYLFAGYSTLTQPFAQSGSGATYVGDHGVRLLQTSPTQRIADSHSGYDLFMSVAQGNGTFVTSANAANTGSGSIDSGSVPNPAAWVPDTYTLRFTTPTDYEVVDSAAVVVTTGTYTSGSAINFNGAQITVSGQPATADEFTIARSGAEDMFTTLGKLVTTLGRGKGNPADSAQFATEMGATLTQLDQALDHTSGVRSEVGARLSVLEEALSSGADRDLELNTALSQLRDLDYAEAMTRLNVQLLGLEAAQKSYTHLAQLSLFNYF